MCDRDITCSQVLAVIIEERRDACGAPISLFGTRARMTPPCSRVANGSLVTCDCPNANLILDFKRNDRSLFVNGPTARFCSAGVISSNLKKVDIRSARRDGESGV